MKIEIGSEWISDSDGSMEFLVLDVGNTVDCPVKYEVYSNGHYMGESESNKYTFLFSKSPLISIQEQAYEEGYDQAIDDLIEAGVIGEDEGEYLDEGYSEYEFGDVEDDEDGEEEYCFSKELERVLNGKFASSINFDEKTGEDLDEYNRGYEDGKSRGITLGYNKRDYEHSKANNSDFWAYLKEQDDKLIEDDEKERLMERKHSHYFKDVRHLDYIDVYQVCKLFPIDDDSGAITHARKKLLVAGGRGAGKDMIKDITEARDTLNRYLQIEGVE